MRIEEYTCNKPSSPTLIATSVLVVLRNPVSYTSSTVSPTARTRVDVGKDTTMYLSCSSRVAFLTVHTAEGLWGSADTAISVTSRLRAPSTKNKRSEGARYHDEAHARKIAIHDRTVHIFGVSLL